MFILFYMYFYRSIDPAENFTTDFKLKIPSIFFILYKLKMMKHLTILVICLIAFSASQTCGEG